MEDRSYRSFSEYLREKFGERVYRVSLDAGFSCPNRDGKLGTEGCAYCCEQGSWGGTGKRLSLEDQVVRGKQIARKRYRAQKFIAYFQAYSNTYADVEVLKRVYDSVVVGDKDFVGIAVGTRPDCVDREKLGLISSYKRMGFEAWIEYGLQSAHDATLQRIGRGHTVQDFKNAVLLTEEYDILVTAHLIIGLPDEGEEEVKRTALFCASLPIHGVKIHNLNIVGNTRMAEWYSEGKIRPLDMEEYAHLVVDFLERIRPDTVIDRLVAESDPTSLIEPRWSLKKHEVIRCIEKEFARRNSFQGKLFSERAT